MAETFCVHSKTDWDCRSCRRRIRSQMRSLYAERDERTQQLDRLLGAIEISKATMPRKLSDAGVNKGLYEVAEEITKEKNDG